MQSFILVRILILYFLPYGLTVDCPILCRCYRQSTIYSISCLDAGLTRIPNFFNFDVKILNFTGNTLPTLRDMFQNQRYRSLEILDLSRNAIVTVQDRSFHKLKNLLEIDISKNVISSIGRELFKNNHFLNTARFGGNPIEEIEQYAFAPSIYLRNLDFEGCRIKKIHKYAFVNTPMLEYLNLKENNLRTLSTNVFYYTVQLDRLLLDGNPWKCNKKLWVLLKWLHDRNLTTNSLLCVYGETENAILWDTMDFDNPAKFRKRQITGNVKPIKWSSRRKRKRVRRSLEFTDTEQRPYNKIIKWKQDLSRIKQRREDDPEPRGSFNADNMDYVVDKPWFNIHESQYDVLNPMSTFENQRNRHYLPADKNNKFESRQYDTLFSELADKNTHSYRRVNKNSSSLSNTNKFYDNSSDRADDKTFANLLDNSFRNSFFANGNQLIMSYNNAENTDTIETIRTPFNNEIHDSSWSNKRTETNVDDTETNDTNDEPENMKIMFSFIAVEGVLLTILLFILYKLWQWNRRTQNSAANTPLNDNKTVKTYDTQSPGYKR